MKRIANKELNKDNWDEEDSPEERGRFNVADGEIISKRKVLTVKRKQFSNQSGVFKSFGGFFTQNKPQIFNEFLNNNDNREKHLNNLKHLNRSFIKNIQKYVLENECCILSPLFEDYQRYISTINSKYPLNIDDKSTFKFDIKSKITNDVIESTKIDNTVINFVDETIPSNFSFELNSITPSLVDDDDDDKIRDCSLFGANTLQPKDETKLFGIIPSLGGDKTSDNNLSIFRNSIFQVKPQENVAKEEEEEEEEEYVPPKPEICDIKESDSVFDIRCKLFYFNDKDWKEKGVGNLFIKPLSTGKCQLVMRTDNTLGTILLNIILTKEMPLTVNKNNLSLVAMTDFTGDEIKSTSLLIRVKTAVNADELFRAIKKQVDNE